MRGAPKLLPRSRVLTRAGLAFLVSLALAWAAGAAAELAAPTVFGPAESAVSAQSDSGLLTWMEGYTLVLLSTQDARSFAAARDAIQAAGATVAVAVPPAVILGWVPPELESAVLSVQGVEGIHRTPVPETLIDRLRGRDETNATAVEFFNSVASGAWRQELLRQRDESLFSPSGLPLEREPLIKDSFEPPQLNLDAYLENLRSVGYDATAEAERLSRGGSIFGVTGNSDDMVGTVTVTLFFVESDGSIDPNTYTWGTSQLNNTVNNAISGLSWWSSRAATYGKTVSFTVYYYPGTDVRCQIGYEPVLHPSSDVPTWVSEIMSSFGYSSGSHYDQVAAYNTWARSNYGTNWAFSSFIEYNPPPAGVAFTDGYAAWAYLGGPYSNLLYRSFNWPFNSVYSHETGHIFQACDEYFESGYGGCMSCGACSHGIANGNCEYCNPHAVACMMNANDDALCAYTPGHLGWLSAPIVKYSSHTIQDPTGNKNGMVDAGESVTMPLTLKNWGLPVTGVSATLTTADPYITITGNYSTFSNMVLDQSATTAVPYAFSASPSTPSTHVATFTLNIVGSGYDTTSSFDIQVGLEPVLLVDDDNGFTYETYYENALTAAGYGYYYWSVSTRGAPPLSELVKRDVVVWFTSQERDLTLTGLDERNLTSYLNQGGTLFLSSQDYLFERFESFAMDILHVTAFTGETSSITETGVTGDPISDGMTLGMSYVTPLWNFSDDIIPDSRSAAVFMNSTGYPGALRFPAVGTAPYKVVFFAFPFEAIADGTPPNDRASVMGKVVEWLMLPQDYQPPAVEVTSPNGGEEWASGTQHEITWIATDNVRVDSVSILFSRDGGLSFPDTLASREANDSTFTWEIPHTPSDSCLIKVIAYDASLNSSEDVSDAFFKIPPAEVPGVVAFDLLQNYPNPFNPTTNIVFSLDRDCRASLRVFDVSGRLVRTLADGPQAAGRYIVPWDGKDDSGKLTAPGVYSYLLENDRQSASRKMVLLR